MKAIVALVLSILLASAGPVLAGGRTVVVELFTSQGCSSCPPADEMMRQLVVKPNVIALSLHVDYWDYIGWKDQFADPAYTKRQKVYAHASGRNMVYTPQMIINGQDQVVGARAMELAELVMAHSVVAPVVDLVVERVGDRLRVRLHPVGPDVPGDYVIDLVRYTPERSVDITRGENAGRRLTYLNVVDGWQTLGAWDGQASLELEAEITGPRPAAILVQRRGAGPIVAAARVE